MPLINSLIKIGVASSILLTPMFYIYAAETTAAPPLLATASARKKIATRYSCEYKIIYANKEKQNTFENLQLAKKSLPFVYTKTIDFVSQSEDHPISLPSGNIKTKVTFNLKMDGKADNIKISPSTDSAQLDQRIINAFLIAQFSTQQKLWWGGRFIFSEEIQLESTGHCKEYPIYEKYAEGTQT